MWSTSFFYTFTWFQRHSTNWTNQQPSFRVIPSIQYQKNLHVNKLKGRISFVTKLFEIFLTLKFELALLVGFVCCKISSCEGGMPKKFLHIVRTGLFGITHKYHFMNFDGEIRPSRMLITEIISKVVASLFASILPARLAHANI